MSSVRRNGRQFPHVFEWALNEAWQDAHRPPEGRQPAPKPKCDGRSAEFADYRVKPTAAEAEDLCAGCPMMDYVPLRDMNLPGGIVYPAGVFLGKICRKAAHHIRPETGVWGGEVWDAKKVVREENS